METGETQSPRLRDILEGIVAQIGSGQRKKILLPSVIPTLNSRLVGMLESEVWILGGYSSTGKTFLSLQMALEAAQHNFNVGYFSLEMSVEALALRLWGAKAGIQPLRLEFGQFQLEELQRTKEAKTELADLQISLYDDLYTVEEIAGEIEANRFDFVVVDFIQNLLSEKGESEYDKLTRAVIYLQKLAKSAKSVILINSQLSNVEAKEGASSKIIGYKGSGALAAACDMGLWLEKEADYLSAQQNYTLFVRKNRRGSLFKIPLRFDFPKGFFVETT